jgi:hypothetical protein
MIYCCGFCVDSAGDLYYAPNSSPKGTFPGSILLHFNHLGKSLEKIRLKSGEKAFLIRGLLTDSRKLRYALGYSGGSRFLLKFLVMR